MKLDMNLLDFKNKNVIPMLLVGALYLIFVIDLFLYIPSFISMNQFTQEQKKDHEKTSVIVKQLNDSSKALSYQLISNEGIDQVFDDITKIADKNEIDIAFKNSAGVDKPAKEEDPFAQKTFMVDVGGSFKNIGIFLSAVKDIPNVVIGTDSVTISRNMRNLSNVQVQINFVFYMEK